MSSTTGGTYGAPPAPVGRRVAASLVDGALTAVAAGPLLLATVPPALAAARDPQDAGAAPSPVLLVAGAVLLLAWAAVQWVCQGTRGWTVGRRALGLRTLDVRTGHPLGLGRALVRTLVVAAGALACGIGQLVVLLSPLFDGTGRYRGWHDRVAEAIVVDVRGRPAARRVGAAPRRAAATPPEHTGPAVPHPSAVPAPAAPAPAAPGSAAPGEDDPGAVHRTRWTALAAERQLGGPGLVLPPLAAPGLGPDLDTRQLPRVPAVGAEDGRARHAVPPEPGAPPLLAPRPGAWPAAPAGPAFPPAPPVGAAPVPPLGAAPVPPPGPYPGPAGAGDAPGARPGPAAPSDALGALGEPGVPDLPPLPPVLFPAAETPAVAPSSSWAARLPDGSVLPLEVPLLVGRNPDPLPGVRPVPVADPSRSVSKTHLLVGVDEHGPWVVDRGSTNGTLVTLADGQRIVCLPDRRVRLTDGSLVAFGDLSLSVGVRA